MFFVETLKVSAKSNPKSVAGAIAAVLREGKEAHVHAIGAGAVNQAVKAIAIAHGYLAPNGKNIVTVPAFVDVEIDGEEKTGMKFIVRAS
jgi:stage V sporulation protein S